MASNKRADLILTRGITSIREGIKARFPSLSQRDQELLAESLLDEVGRRIKAGEDIAFVKKLPNGQAKVQFVDLASARKRK